MTLFRVGVGWRCRSRDRRDSRARVKLKGHGFRAHNRVRMPGVARRGAQERAVDVQVLDEVHARRVLAFANLSFACTYF